ATNAAPARTRHPVAHGPVDAEADQEEEADECEETERVHRCRVLTEGEGDRTCYERERQKDAEEHHQEADEQLLAGAGVLERLAVEAHGRPDAAADLGLTPEVVDTERQNPEHEIDEAEPDQARRLLPGERHRLGAEAGPGTRSSPVRHAIFLTQRSFNGRYIG